jgi:hypothetical protein
MEVVYRQSRSEYEQKHYSYLDKKPQERGQCNDIISRTDKKHYGHESKKREKTCTSEEQLAEHQSDDNAEKHRQTSQYRHRMVLELSRIRIVDDILHLRDAMYLPEDP